VRCSDCGVGLELFAWDMRKIPFDLHRWNDDLDMGIAGGRDAIGQVSSLASRVLWCHATAARETGLGSETAVSKLWQIVTMKRRPLNV
jgi:hypothetical protein